MDTNIQQSWRLTLDEARQKWRTGILDSLEPELNKRGIVVDSRSGANTGESYIALWFCSKPGVYLEISASTSTAFTVKVIIGGQVSLWPTSSQSIYDRQNYTISQLLDWIDKQPWIV